MAGIETDGFSYLDKVLDEKIEKRIQNPPKTYKGIVQRIDKDGIAWVNIIGGEMTPVTELSTIVKAGDLIDVTIENGVAYGSASSSPAMTVDLMYAILKALVGKSNTSYSEDELAVFQNIKADQGFFKAIEAVSGNFESISAKEAGFERLTARWFKADSAEIENLYVRAAEILSLVAGSITVDQLKAKDATIEDLFAEDAIIQALVANQVTTKDLLANRAYVFGLLSDNATVDNLIAGDTDIAYADIISQQGLYAAIQQLMVESGWFKYVEAGSAKVGYLDAVHIDAYDVEIEHLKVHDLYLFDTHTEDGIWYQLNITAGGISYSDLTPDMQQEVKEGFHGDNIIAGTVTADKIYVNDLEAFNATIAGMVFDEITIAGSTYYAMHTLGKTGVTSNTPGIYIDQLGQVAIGTGSDYIALYQDTNGQWKMTISGSNIEIGPVGSAKTLQTLISEIDNTIESWSGSYVPTLTNLPASNWSTSSDRNKHIGDMFYNAATGTMYRFSNVEGVYTWAPIKGEAGVPEVVRNGSTDDTTRELATNGAVQLELLKIDALYGESVQNGTPTVSDPVPIECVKPTVVNSPNLVVTVASGDTVSIDMTDPVSGNVIELHGLDDTYRDILTVDTNGKVTVTKMCAMTTQATTEGITPTIYMSTTGDLSDGATVIYPAASPTTIELGYVNLPRVADNTTVYVEAEVQPNFDASWWLDYEVGSAWQDSMTNDRYAPTFAQQGNVLVIDDGRGSTLSFENTDTGQWQFGIEVDDSDLTAFVTTAQVGSYYLNVQTTKVYECIYRNDSTSQMTWEYRGDIANGVELRLDARINQAAEETKWITTVAGGVRFADVTMDTSVDPPERVYSPAGVVINDTVVTVGYTNGYPSTQVTSDGMKTISADNTVVNAFGHYTVGGTYQTVSTPSLKSDGTPYTPEIVMRLGDDTGMNIVATTSFTDVNGATVSYLLFRNKTEIVAYIKNSSAEGSVFYMNKAIVVTELRFADWKWYGRSNGNVALKYVG